MSFTGVFSNIEVCFKTNQTESKMPIFKAASTLKFSENLGCPREFQAFKLAIHRTAAQNKRDE